MKNVHALVYGFDSVELFKSYEEMVKFSIEYLHEQEAELSEGVVEEFGENVEITEDNYVSVFKATKKNSDSAGYSLRHYDLEMPDEVDEIFTLVTETDTLCIFLNEEDLITASTKWVELYGPDAFENIVEEHGVNGILEVTRENYADLLNALNNEMDKMGEAPYLLSRNRFSIGSEYSLSTPKM